MKMKKNYILVVCVLIITILGFFFILKRTPNQMDDRCKLQPDPGPCEAVIQKYYFDQVERVCKEFIWGGCDGVVPFDTLEECKQVCEK
jgi:hypothetical protein